jgi:Met-zincin/Domain of unknown function (DUF5117)/Domain of unknown function (DUF5118)
MKIKGYFSRAEGRGSQALTCRFTTTFTGLLLALICCSTFPGRLAAEDPPKPKSKFKEFGEVTKDTQRYEGLFTLYKTNEDVYFEIKPNQLDQPFLAPIAIARGLAMAGQPLNFGDEWIIVFRRVDDNIQLLRRNIHYEAPKGTPLEKAVEQNYTDSVLMSLPIVSINPGGSGVLVDASQIFLSDFAQLGLGEFDKNRSRWSKIKTFPNNLELEIEATYGHRGGPVRFGDDGLADSRGITLVIHYSICKLPESGYKPRFADHRVGHFLSATKDFGSADPDTVFMRRINRWRLEKSDPKAKVSPPKKQLVWWVEDTVPHEFRPFVEEGILEWNKAFEKIGFRSAIGVRWQNERDDFDPEDINYCTFRWITTSSTYAMSGLRANPITGEMIDGDVIFDASWIRYLKEEYATLVGKSVTGEGEEWVPLAQAEIISPIMAAKYGYGLPFPLIRPNPSWAGQDGRPMISQLVPSGWSPVQMQLARRFAQGQSTVCQCALGKAQELSMAVIAMAASGKASPDEKLPEEFLGQTIKEIVMHEVGHSLGLRHNFKASTMLPLDKVNDTNITHLKGMVGSVMDYNPVNISRKGQPQGDYATTTIGPYDYWAIEYAYKPIEGDEPEELKKIAARSPDPDLAYATDEDMFLNDDPYVNTYDLGSDPLKYGEDRVALAGELIQSLEDKIVKDGESWARLRRAFSVLLGQYGNAAYLASSYIGGQSVSRDFKGGEGSHDPVTPIAGEKQREALEFLSKNLLVGDAFHFPPALLRRLTSDNWYHWGSDGMLGGGVDYPIYERVLAMQRIVLNRCFDPAVLSRLQNQELQCQPDGKPLKMAEVFQTLTDAIWGQLTPGKDPAVATMHRNLQREHLSRLCRLVLGQRRDPFGDMYGYAVLLGGSSTPPADARSLARFHLQHIQEKIDKALGGGLDDTTKAHLVECRERIKKVLDASYTANDL